MKPSNSGASSEGTSDKITEGPAVGYSLILPPNWKRIPLRRKRDREATVREIVAAACSALPRGFPRDVTTRYRLEIERRLNAGISNARKSGGLDFYLPIMEPGGSPIATSFVVGEITSDQDSMRFLERMTAGSDYKSIEVDRAPGIRREVVVDADPEGEIELASRRVDYVAAVPGNFGRVLTISFSTFGGGDPRDDLADATVTLFDAIITTFRWSTE
ncbi:hypothetical protein ACWD11_03640 [Streptomyces sp. NPDC002776]